MAAVRAPPADVYSTVNDTKLIYDKCAKNVIELPPRKPEIFYLPPSLSDADVCALLVKLSNFCSVFFFLCVRSPSVGIDFMEY